MPARFHNFNEGQVISPDDLRCIGLIVSNRWYAVGLMTNRYKCRVPAWCEETGPAPSLYLQRPEANVLDHSNTASSSLVTPGTD